MVILKKKSFCLACTLIKGLYSLLVGDILILPCLLILDPQDPTQQVYSPAQVR